MEVESLKADRFGSYIDFKLSGKKFTEYITVENCRLFYDYNNKQ